MEQKKIYETPELKTFGSIESITKGTFRLGSGDWMTDILQEIVDPNINDACNPRRETCGGPYRLYGS